MLDGIITFTPLRKKHFPLLLKWLEASHVKAYWDKDASYTPQKIEEKYESYTRNCKIEKGGKREIFAYVVYYNAEPIGYIQYYNFHDFPRQYECNSDFNLLPENLAALDWFIGEEDFVGKGLSHIICQIFMKQVITSGYKACFVDPEMSNMKAIKSYTKAGFVVTKITDDYLWMIKNL